jgi:hypothetical protein
MDSLCFFFWTAIRGVITIPPLVNIPQKLI